MFALEGEELLHHLFTDLLWKIGIVAVAAIVVILAMIVIYRVVNKK
ncbi:hypothetical protein [Actinoplanes regularis]|uniref:Uncharacterized protein n=1 Tax=Actinoplanes regularis TaxID=52697 RepID=A0A239F0Z2_9ACTN|nr:hypothetical protein [Actinoplanes regularis]GIE89906.1 hypothetical protein Are01nite_63860 [Actinoplanes regularis]GLW33538.1 hypothetical protein Areg01_64760 [Actinoplanes regularis]SNS50371.1 hypothetical protein SAMN06264365_11717 [Actinoplanes regularis]